MHILFIYNKISSPSIYLTIHKFKLVEFQKNPKKIDIQLQLGDQTIIKFARQTSVNFLIYRSSTKLTRLPRTISVDRSDRLVVFFHLHGALRAGSAGGDQLLKHR